MENVFMPTNIEMYTAITTKADLLIESQMPECLLELCAHVTAYKPVLKMWSQSDYSEHLSYVGYPNDALLEYTRLSFQELKAEQAKLMGASRKS